MYYYLTVSYDIHDLELSEISKLIGPFLTIEDRALAIATKASQTEFDGVVINITLLKVEDGKLIREQSGLLMNGIFNIQ